MLDKLENSPLNLKATSVYNFNEFTLTELLNKFFTTINQCVDGTNQSLDFLTWLKGEGLPIELEKELNKMYEDGRIQESINSISGDLTYKVNEVKDVLNKTKNQLDEKTKEIKDLTTLKAIDLDEGSIINVNINELIKGKYVITNSGMDNDYSVIKLNNNKYATRFYDNYNEWSKSLGSGYYIAHKGFNGCDNESSVNGTYPENSLKAFEKAGEYGYKMIETDALVTSDGEWVVSHELDTKYLSGDLVNISDITLTELKNRNFVKQYIGTSKYWDFTGENTNLKIPTLKEMLMACKKYNMYAIVEIKWVEPYYTEQNFIDFANIIKNCAMENKVIVYGSRPSVMSAMKYLPNSIAGFTEIIDDNYLKLIKSYKNHFISISEEKYNNSKQLIKDNNIPCAIWTIDNYIKADRLFSDGVNGVLTNVLLNNLKRDNLNTKISYDIEQFYNEVPTTGVGEISYNEKTMYLSTTTYYAKSLVVKSELLKNGDIIKVKASGRTTNGTTNFGRIHITNNNSNALRSKQVNFEGKNFETKECYYVVNDVSENVMIWIGHSGGGASGVATSEWRDIKIEILTNELIDDNERYAYIYSTTDNFAIRSGYVNKGIKNLTINGGILEVEYTPFKNSNGYPLVITSPVYYSTNYNRKILPDIMNSDTTNNKVKIRFAEADGTMINNISGGMAMGFVLQIKN